MSKEWAAQLLGQDFLPTYLKVEDQSHLHQGHAGHSGRHGSHLAVTIVSSSFEGDSLIQRHKKINGSLKPLFDDGLHALKITAESPA